MQGVTKRLTESLYLRPTVSPDAECCPEWSLPDWYFDCGSEPRLLV